MLICRAGPECGDCILRKVSYLLSLGRKQKPETSGGSISHPKQDVKTFFVSKLLVCLALGEMIHNRIFSAGSNESKWWLDPTKELARPWSLQTSKPVKS